LDYGAMTKEAEVKANDPVKIVSWLQSRPSAQELRAAFPGEWETMERELATAIAERDPSRLHRLLNARHAGSDKKATLSKREKVALAQAAVRQRMAALAIENYSLAIGAGQTSGKIRFNLFNGMLAQKLLFKTKFERKPVSLLWFRLLWPLVWQKRYLMPLVERRGIYCFYSRQFVARLTDLIAGRSCLEIGAGDGTLARFLEESGVTVTATDDYSWSDRIRYPDTVLRMDARSALRQQAPKVVLCSWPPAQNTFEREVFRTASVELYVVVLSRHRFASGNWADYEAQSDFLLAHRPDLSRLLLPPELGSAVLVFRRQERREVRKDLYCRGQRHDQR
jgi:hypothetical protein